MFRRYGVDITTHQSSDKWGYKVHLMVRGHSIMSIEGKQVFDHATEAIDAGQKKIEEMFSSCDKEITDEV